MTTIDSYGLTFQSAGQDWRAFVAAPEKPKGAIIVIHEIWGLNDDIRRITRDFAEAGYLAVAPDLYSQDDPVEEVNEEVFVRVFSDPFRKSALGALHDLRAWVIEQGWTAEQIAMTGFCFGGTYTLQYLLAYDDIAGGISFYGQTPDEDSIRRLNKPLLAFYGQDDGFLTPHRERMLEYAQKLELPIDVETYANAEHSFMNQHRDGSYRPESAADAWQKTMAFLGENLES